MRTAESSSPSLLRELVEGFFTLLFGVLVQLGRLLLLIWRKGVRFVTRRRLRTASIKMGSRMAVAGVGDDLLLQRLKSLPPHARERTAILEQLGKSALQLQVPTLGLEPEYRAWRPKYEVACRAERRHDEIATRMWPKSSIVRSALAGSYLFYLISITAGAVYLYNNIYQEPLPPPSPPPPPPPPPLSVKIGDVLVSIKEAKIGAVALDFPKDKSKRIFDDLDLILKLNIENTGKNPIVYETWRGNFPSPKDSPARVVDDRGFRLAIYVYAPGTKFPSDWITKPTEISPGSSIEDTVVFAAPMPKFKYIDVFLPGENVGLAGETGRINIPAENVEMPEKFK